MNPRLARHLALKDVLTLASSFLLLLTWSAVAAEPIPPEIASRHNILSNGGFEDGERLPDVWSRYPPQDTEWAGHVRDTTVSHSGGASGLLVALAPKPPGKPPLQWNKYGIPVKGGSSLIASMWVKTEGSMYVWAGVHFYDKDGKHLGFFRISGPRESRDWTHFGQAVRIPDDAATIGLAAYVNGKGKAWYDDVALIGVPQAAAVRATPVIDGSLDDACWKQQEPITEFAVHPGTRLPSEPVRAWLAYDERNVYAAFRCPHPNRARLKQNAVMHDGRTWLDDSVEVFIDPGQAYGRYYQFAVNCLGVVRDSMRMDPAWESGARTGVLRTATEWSVELAIPFENMDISLDTGTRWGINLVWNDRVHAQTCTWSLGGFHAPGRFGTVALQNDFSRFFRRDLARRIDAVNGRRNDLLEEFRGAGLTRDKAVEPFRILDTVKVKSDTLRLTAGGGKLPEGGWDAARKRLSEVESMLEHARMAAISSLFSALEADGGFRVIVAGSLQKIPRSGLVVNGMIASSVELEAARDEAESFQLVVVPNGKALAGVQVSAPPLSGPGGELPLKWYRVGYVETASPGYEPEYVGWWPDALLPAAPFDVKADERQPVWFTAVVPPDAAPGDYSGHVKIACGEGSVSVPVRLKVRNFRIPRPGTLAMPFGLYGFALSGGLYGNSAYFKNMPIELYAEWCRFLGEYRLTPKNIARDYAPIVTDERGRHPDLSRLKQTVGALADDYFPPYSYCIFRLPSSPTMKDSGWYKDLDAAVEFLKRHVEEWERAGLPSNVYIYGFDEPHREDYPFLVEAYKKIKAAVPGYPIMQTIGDPNPEELVGLVDIWCPLTARLSDFYKQRQAAGDVLWTYVCCSPKPPYANFFVDQPATAHRALFWQVRQAGCTGLLYWCVCYWGGIKMVAAGQEGFPDQPVRLTEHCSYNSHKVNGDGVLVYPGPDRKPWPTVRLEVIRDGVEDYEYLSLLQRLVDKAKALPEGERPDKELIEKAEALCVVPESISRTLTEYTDNPEDILSRRRQIADMIEALQ